MSYPEPPVLGAVRAAAARLAAVSRWFPDDAEKITAAKRDLLLAHATAKVASAAADLLGLNGNGGLR